MHIIFALRQYQVAHWTWLDTLLHSYVLSCFDIIVTPSNATHEPDTSMQKLSKHSLAVVVVFMQRSEILSLAKFVVLRRVQDGEVMLIIQYDVIHAQ